jgi:hypothetical protein
MADEITVSASLAYEDSEDSDEILQIADVLFDITTKKYIKHKQNVGTSEEAMDLGELTTLGWCIILNRDATNYIEVRMATGAGNDHIKVPAGGAAVFHFGSDVTAPFLIANTAACQVEYLLLAQ